MRLITFPKVVSMPKLLTSLTIFLLALSSTFFPAMAQQGSRFPSDSRFDQIIEFQVGPEGTKLEDYLRIIGKSVGLQVLPEAIPDRTLGSAWSVKKPFRQVWDTLITLYGLDYVLQPNNVVVVGPPSVIEKFLPKTTTPVTTTQQNPVQQTPVAPAIEIRTYVVSGDPTALKAFLESTYPSIKVTVPPNQKLLVIAATAAEHVQVRELLAQVDKPLPPTTTTSVIPTELRSYDVNGDPEGLKKFLEGAFPTIKVNVPPNQKVLIVSATAAEHDQVAKVLVQVDKPIPPIQTAPAITPVTQTYEVNGDPEGLKKFLESTYPNLRVTVPPNQKLLIVTGTPTEQNQVKNLLARVDIAQTVSAPPPAVVTEVKTYEVNGDPTALKVFLENTYPGIKVTVAPSQKILIVNATTTEQAQVKQLLATVDKPTPAVIVTPTVIVRKTYTLSYTRAGKLAAVLNQITAGPQPTTPDSGGTTTTTNGLTSSTTVPTVTPATTSLVVNSSTSNGTQGSTLPGATSAAPINVTIVADEDSNTLIISGTPAQVDSILAVLPSLDKPQSLVNIGIRVQEVVDSASRKLGIDWSLGLGNFSGSILNGGLNFLFDATRSLAGLNIGASLDALETQKLSKKVNDATLSVLNYGRGFLRSGGRIELQTINGTKTLTYGVQLEVIPNVASNGDITLNLKSNISNILDANNTSATRIDFNDRQLDSTVRIKDGQTLLLGSLLTTSQDSTTQGIPVLSAIPLIGDLFKNSSSSSDQTQLLIVVTANVIK
jgi:type II secretory pathway component GspD/PulD (secretin)